MGEGGMLERLKFYIDGKWVDPVTPKTLEVINPANEEPFAKISLGSKADVDKAVAAARRAFETFSRTTREERAALLERIIAAYQKRYAEIASTITMEMGAPSRLSTAIVPPIISTSCLEMARPSPVPPYLRVVELSAWVKAVNSRPI